MPISDEDQREANKSRSTVDAARKLKETYELTEALKKQQAVVGAGTKKFDELQEVIDGLVKSEDTYIKMLKKEIEEMERENTTLNKLIRSYTKKAEVLAQVATKVKPLVTEYHAYNMEVQKIVDLSGKFTGKFNEGIKAFEKMTKALSLTRKEAEDFGKTWSEAMRRGIDTEQFTRSVNNLRNVFGQKGGIGAVSQIMQVPVSRATMQGVMSGDQVAIARAARNANMEQIYAMSGLSGGQKGVASGMAARYEKTGAMVSRFRDDIEAGMAAGLQMGLAPEVAALAVPLAEMNVNIARIANDNSGIMGWVKSLLSAGVAGGASAAGTAAATGGTAGFAGIGARAAGWGSKLLAAGKVGLRGAGPGLGFSAFGYGADYLANQIGEDETSPWRSGVRAGLKSGGRVARVAGLGLTGAAVGTAILPGVGTAIGAGVGTAAGAYMESGGEQKISAFDQALTKYGAVVEEMAKEMEGTVAEVGKLPSVLEKQVLQSRLPVALESIDPGPMEEYVKAASMAFSDSMDLTTRTWKDQLSRLDAGIADTIQKIEEARLRGEETGGLEEVGRNYETQKAIATAKAQAEFSRHSLMPEAENVRRRLETRKGQMGLETQAVQARYERTYGGTGNVEEMQKVRDQVSTMWEETLKETEKDAKTERSLLSQERDRWQMQIDLGQLDEAGLKEARSRVANLTNRIAQSRREIVLMKEQGEAEKHQRDIGLLTEQALAATQTIYFKVSERRMALARSQQEFARERGAGPEEVGRLAGKQASQARYQLDRILDDFDKQMGKLEAAKVAPGATPADRERIEKAIYDLSDKRLQAERQNYQMQIQAATAEEQHRQELIGANKHISEIQRDTAAKLGLSWRVQMGFQSQIIKASQQDLESKGREVSQMANAIKNAGGDPAKNIEYVKKQGEYLQKQADLTESIIGKQRSFLEQATAASFGVGSGSKVSPIINPRMFGQMVQGATGMKQAGAPMTVQQQQQILMRGLGPVFGGIGGGVGPMGGGPGLPGGPGVPGQPGVPGAGPGAALGGAAGGPQVADITGQIKIELDTQLLQVAFAKFQRTNNLPGGGPMAT